MRWQVTRVSDSDAAGIICLWKKCGKDSLFFVTTQSSLHWTYLNCCKGIQYEQVKILRFFFWIQNCEWLYFLISMFALGPGVLTVCSTYIQSSITLDPRCLNTPWTKWMIYFWMLWIIFFVAIVLKHYWSIAFPLILLFLCCSRLHFSNFPCRVNKTGFAMP